MEAQLELEAGKYRLSLTKIEEGDGNGQGEGPPPEPQPPSEDQAGLALYGAGAWPYQATKPIGGGEGWQSQFTEKAAKDHPETAKELSSALASASSDQHLIWIPDGKVISLTEAYRVPVKKGVILGGGRGTSKNPGRIKSSYDTDAYMIEVLKGLSYSTIFGLIFEGPRGLGEVSKCGPCALRMDGQKGVLIENCEVFNFSCGGLWFGDGNPGITRWDDDKQRNIVRGCYIHNIQRHGFGYGVGEQGGSQSFLLEASIVDECRHLTMAQAGSDSYEARYCRFGEAVYNTRKDGSGTWYNNHQVDVHGGGSDGSPAAGAHFRVTFCTFAANNRYQPKLNAAIRGVPSGEAIFKWNWTKKTFRSGLNDETKVNSAFSLADGGGGSWSGENNLEKYNVFVDENWYGLTPPPVKA